ncbi:MAG: hypothetical protein P4L84_33630 [Isosphaeraceae bacterium]|nr:hypothetical protein [Isosphaeraceae bacterium]
MAIVLPPIGGSSLDLVPLSLAQSSLAEVLPSDQSYLATAVTAASRAVQRYCRRWFLLQSYLEIRTPQPGQWDKGDPDLILLGQYPIVGPARLRTGRQYAVQVVNNDNVTNQEAYVGFTTSGDPDISLTNTGLTLTRVASGVQTVDTISWSVSPPYTTTQDVVNAINALGGGWNAVLQSPALAKLGAYNLYGSEGSSGALATSQCMLNIFSRDLSCARIDVASGTVFLAADASGYGNYGSGLGSDWLWPGGIDSPTGAGNFRPEVLCSYQAGYATIPQDVQTAVLAIIKVLLQELQTNTRYDSETAADATVRLAEIGERTMPKSVKKLLAPWRIHRVN